MTFDLMECVRLDVDDMERNGIIPCPENRQRLVEQRGLVTAIDGEWREVVWKGGLLGSAKARFLRPAKLT